MFKGMIVSTKGLAKRDELEVRMIDHVEKVTTGYTIAPRSVALKFQNICVEFKSNIVSQVLGNSEQTLG
jgi:hypothetical protein